MQSDWQRFRHPLVIAFCAILGAFLISYVASCNRSKTEETEYKELAMQFLHPRFSDAFCKYFHIDNLQDYKRALEQQFRMASFDAMEGSYGESEPELLHFHRLRMINWLDLRMIERAEYLIQFDRRGDEDVGPSSIDLEPLSDAEFKSRVPY